MSKVLSLILLGLTAMIQGKKIKIGINGFGKMGRMVLRAALNKPELEVVAINDPFMSPQQMQYQFKYYSARETFPGKISFDNKETLTINEHTMRVFAEVNPSKIDWKSVGVEFVVECSGIFNNVKQANKHLHGTVKKVVVSAPNDGEMFVMGVNQNDYKTNTNIISNADYTTNAVAPLIKVLHEKFRIKNGLLTTQKSLHNHHKKWRSAAESVGKVYKPVDGLLKDMAVKVPVPDGNVVDLVVTLEKDATVEEVNAALKGASESDMKGFIGYTEDALVSSGTCDVIGNPLLSMVDSKCTMAVNSNTFKIISWYHNEWGYSNRLCDLVIHAGKQDGLL